MIYLDHLNQPEPRATISKFGGSSVYPGQVSGMLVLTSTAKNAPDKQWDYTSKDVSHIVSEMEAEGWVCDVDRDGYGHPVISLTHVETQKALDALTIDFVGEGESGYIRFGNLPPDGRSTNKVTGEREPGVSVYRATFFENGYRIETPWYSQGTYISVSERKPILRVWGDVVGTGSDGEPCITITHTKEINCATIIS